MQNRKTGTMNFFILLVCLTQTLSVCSLSGHTPAESLLLLTECQRDEIFKHYDKYTVTFTYMFSNSGMGEYVIAKVPLEKL